MATTKADKVAEKAPEWRCFVDLLDGDDFALSYDTEADARAAAKGIIATGFVVRDGESLSVYYPSTNIRSITVRKKHE